MATTYADAKPLRSRGYDKIILLTALAIVVGVGLMGWEFFVDYGGQTAMPNKPQPKKIAPLPPAEKAPPAPAGPGGPVPPGPPGPPMGGTQ